MQQGADINTAVGNAWMNNTNQVTPFGTLTYKPVSYQPVGNGYSVPQFEARMELSPEQQKLFDTQQGISQGTADLAKSYVGRIGEATSKPFSYDGLPAAPQYDEAARVAARDRIVARQEPTFARQEEALRTRLANQGLVPGSEAYSNAMRDFSTGRNDYYLGADARAGDEAARIFGLQGDTRTRAIQERLQERAQPINEVAALLGTGPGVQMPNFVNTPQNGTMQAPDITGSTYASYAGQMQNHQMQQQAQNQLMGSLFGLAGAGLGGWLGGPMGASLGSSLGRRVGGG